MNPDRFGQSSSLPMISSLLSCVPHNCPVSCLSLRIEFWSSLSLSVHPWGCTHSWSGPVDEFGLGLQWCQSTRGPGLPQLCSYCPSLNAEMQKSPALSLWVLFWECCCVGTARKQAKEAQSCRGPLLSRVHTFSWPLCHAALCGLCTVISWSSDWLQKERRYRLMKALSASSRKSDEIVVLIEFCLRY